MLLFRRLLHISINTNKEIINNNNRNDFINRHIQNIENVRDKMLQVINKGDTQDEFIKNVIPKNQHKFISDSESSYSSLSKKYQEKDALSFLSNIMNNNDTSKMPCIGMGYHPTKMPLVIKKNVLNNQNWITAYTPYQSEISQGRLEILYHYQRLISEITGMEISNSGLLDEANAASEVVNIFYNHSKHNKNSETPKKILLSNNLYPITLNAIKTRCHYLNIPFQIINENEYIEYYQNNLYKIIDWNNYFGLILQSPDKNGIVNTNLSNIIQEAKKNDIQVACGTDLMANLVFKSVGELGADVAFGNSQRFGLSLGYGGPHTGFFSTKNKYIRKLPGKLIGKYYDKKTNRDIYRMALQTREQHIRKDKATSNICTSQVLLSNLNAFYGVYHGKEGLLNIANSIHQNTLKLIQNCNNYGINIKYGLNMNENIYDTLCINNENDGYYNYNNYNIFNRLLQEGYLPRFNNGNIYINISELITEKDIDNMSEIIINNVSLTRYTESKNSTNLFENYKNSYGDKTDLFKNDEIFLKPKTETEMVRYIKELESKDYSLTDGMIPLGSCTMKLNASYQLEALNWNSVSNVHPYSPFVLTSGYQSMINQLTKKLLDITGMDYISYQSCSGAMGEYSGLITIANYISKRDGIKYNGDNKLVCLISEAAHGTNFASAKLAGYKIEKVSVNKDGSLSVDDLEKKLKKHSNRVGCLMITYPSTYGIFDDNITDVIDMVHRADGQVYMDGANMNAMCGIIKIGDLGADVCHLNLHKTFCIPHGGGGPGMGPIVIKEHLEEHLPTISENGNNYCNHNYQDTNKCNDDICNNYCSKDIDNGVIDNGVIDNVDSNNSELVGNGVIGSSIYTSASILTIPYLYLLTIDGNDLNNITTRAIINANYIKTKLEDYYDILYTNEKGLVAHEFIIGLSKFNKYGISSKDISKRLIDYSFHPPTMSWPVPNSLMIEPTESESIEELDKFINAMISIRKEIDEIINGEYQEDNNVLVNSPHSMDDLLDWKYPYSVEKAYYPLKYLKKYKKMPSVSRVDDFYGDNELLKYEKK